MDTKEVKHTPGPWDYHGCRVEPNNAPAYDKNDGWIICDCLGPDGEANARLIAAAPELLEALKDAMDRLAYYDERAMVYALNVIIQKAQGPGPEKVANGPM